MPDSGQDSRRGMDKLAYPLPHIYRRHHLLAHHYQSTLGGGGGEEEEVINGRHYSARRKASLSLSLSLFPSLLSAAPPSDQPSLLSTA